MSRSRGRSACFVPLGSRIAPGSFTVLCSYGYLSRASTRIGGVPLSRRCLSSSLVIRRTGTRLYCDRAPRTVSTTGDASARRRASERQHARRASGRYVHVRRRYRRRLALRLLVECPARRPLAAVDAAEEHRSRFTPSAEFVTPREVAIEQVPHREFLDRRSFRLAWGDYPMASKVPPSRAFAGCSRNRKNQQHFWVGFARNDETRTSGKFCSIEGCFWRMANDCVSTPTTFRTAAPGPTGTSVGATAEKHLFLPVPWLSVQRDGGVSKGLRHSL